MNIQSNDQFNKQAYMASTEHADKQSMKQMKKHTSNKKKSTNNQLNKQTYTNHNKNSKSINATYKHTYIKKTHRKQNQLNKHAYIQTNRIAIN